MVNELSVVIEALIAFILALVAWYQSRTAKTNAEIAKTNAVMASVEVSDFKPLKFVMSDSTKNWILSGESEEDKARIKTQIQDAEKQGITSYQIVYSRGGYTIEGNMIKSSWRS